LLLLFRDVDDENDDAGDEDNDDDDDDGCGVGVYSSIVKNLFGSCCCCCCILSKWGCLVVCVWLLRLIIVRIAWVAGC